MTKTQTFCDRCGTKIERKVHALEYRLQLKEPCSVPLSSGNLEICEACAGVVRADLERRTPSPHTYYYTLASEVPAVEPKSPTAEQLESVVGSGRWVNRGPVCPACECQLEARRAFGYTYGYTGHGTRCWLNAAIAHAKGAARKPLK